MRVLLYADLDVSLPGGIETHLRELAAALARRGHHVAIFGRAAPGASLPTVARFDPRDYDVVHHHAGAWPRSLDAEDRTVRTLHFCVAAKMETYVRRGRLRTLLHPGNWRARAAERAAARRRGPLIAVSKRVRDEFARHHGLDPARACVIPNGVTFAPARIGREAWRERHGIPDEARVLLTIGRSDFVKGMDLLARAWPAVRARLPEALWVHVGGGAPARAHGRRATGPVPHEDVREWIEAADLGAFPSYYEGCGLALLEMLAGGLYALTHDVGIVPEAVRPGSNGDIVAPAPRAWAAALSARLPGGRTASSGLDPGYAWPNIAERVEAVYRGILAPCASFS